MLFTVLCISIGFLVPFLWISLPLKRVPKERRLTNKYYVLGVVTGLLLTSLCIFICDEIFDRTTKLSPVVIEIRTVLYLKRTPILYLEGTVKQEVNAPEAKGPV